jgi:hypothetical protein
MVIIKFDSQEKLNLNRCNKQALHPSGLHFCFQALIFLSKDKQIFRITNNSIFSLRFMIAQTSPEITKNHSKG